MDVECRKMIYEKAPVSCDKDELSLSICKLFHGGIKGKLSLPICKSVYGDDKDDLSHSICKLFHGGD